MHKCKERTVILALHCSRDFKKMDGGVPIQLLSSFPLGQVRAIYRMKSPRVTFPLLKVNAVDHDCCGYDYGGYSMRHYYLFNKPTALSACYIPGPVLNSSFTLSHWILQNPYAIGSSITRLFFRRGNLHAEKESILP